MEHKSSWKHPGRRSSDYGLSTDHDHDRRNYSTADYAGVGPRGYNRDQKIHDDICEELKWNPEVDATEIEVHVRNSDVYLEGSVDSRHAKKVAEKIAECTFGVADVFNYLCVRPTFDINSGKAVSRGDDGLFTEESLKKY